jgi:hypothetical protein
VSLLNQVRHTVKQNVCHRLTCNLFHLTSTREQLKKVLNVFKVTEHYLDHRFFVSCYVPELTVDFVLLRRCYNKLKKEHRELKCVLSQRTHEELFTNNGEHSRFLVDFEAFQYSGNLF